MTIPSAPRYIFGQPVRAADPPERANGCAGCANLGRLYQASSLRESELTEENGRLRARALELSVLLGREAPATAEFEVLRARLHALAEQEAAARESYHRAEAELLDRALRAERTMENLHRRFTAIGITP